MARTPTESERSDHCGECKYLWPCREALVKQVAALREGLATIVGAYTSGIYCSNCGASLDTEGCDCIISVARALLAPPAEEEHDAEFEQAAAAAGDAAP